LINNSPCAVKWVIRIDATRQYAEVSGENGLIVCFQAGARTDPILEHGALLFAGISGQGLPDRPS
jgi:hypothetical protein